MNQRVAELERLRATAGETAVARHCSTIIEEHLSRPLEPQAVARISQLLAASSERIERRFLRGQIVELDPSTVEFRRAGDRYGTVVEARAKNVRVWLHTSKRVRSIRASKLTATGQVDVRDPVLAMQDLSPISVGELALLTAAFDGRRHAAPTQENP